jgi:hypothetical protein
MTRYTRSVIPGRQSGEGGRDLDAMVFGVSRRGETVANDIDTDEVEAMPEDEADAFVARARTDRRKGRRRKSDYKPLPDARNGYRPPAESNGRGPLLLVGAVIVVGVFGAVVFNAYRDGVRAEDGETPTLAAAGPFKSRPEPVSTAKVAAREEASVFERVESAPKPVQSGAAEAELAPTPDVRAGKPAVSEPAAVQKAEIPKAAPPKTEPAKLAPAPVPVAPPAPKPVVEPVALAGGFKPAFSSGGAYLVQIGAASTQDGADAEWARRAKTSPDLFGAAEKVVVRADVNGKTVYRVRAGAFATAADADSFCSAFKATGGDCFRTAK